jgi:transposase
MSEVGAIRAARLPHNCALAELNAALYRIAITQARCYAPACAYLERKRAEGKSRREALRCLTRHLARVVFNTLRASPALT